MSSAKIITVDFKNGTLFAVERDDGVFVAVKPISDTLGLAWNKQLERLKRDPILSEGMTMTVLPSPSGAQETTCLRLDLENGWLFGIDENRVRDEETRQRVLSYKRECYGVLFKHFYGRSCAEPRSTPEAIIDVNREEPIMNRRSFVTEARQTHGIQSARELWFKLGLPTTPSMYAHPKQGEFFYTAIKRDNPDSERKAG
ncbi:MAG: phage antirepressor N-terminal domain-containing protein [Janthinobacterium lividum]